MKWFAVVLAATLSVGVVPGQERNQDRAALEAQRQYVVTRLAAEKEDATAMLAHGLALDRKIEAQIASLVDVLAAAKESAVTGGRVVATKRVALMRLRNLVDLYVRERERNAKNQWATKDIDERIDRHIAQMTQLAASLPGEADAKPAVVWGYNAEVEASLKAIQEGKVPESRLRTREDLVEELENAIGLLDAECETLAARAGLAEGEERAALEKELARVQATQARRKTQLDAARNLPATAAGKAVGPDTARFLERLVRQEPVKQDVLRLLQLKHEYDYLRKRVDYLQKELDQIDAELKRLN